MIKVKFGMIKECKNCSYSFNSPAYAFPYEEQPVFTQNLNLKNVLTIASGGGIPMLILLEKGAKKMDVVDISFDAVFLALMRLCSARLRIHREFSEYLLTGGKNGSVLSRLYDNFPEEFKGLSHYGISAYFVIKNAILPRGAIPEDYLREFDIPQDAEITFIVSDISEVKSGNYATLFLSNVLTYALDTMHSFISAVNDHASVLYTVACHPETFCIKGKEFKEKFLPYTQPKHF